MCPASIRDVIAELSGGSDGTYEWTGVSRSSLPSSTSRAAAAAVSTFETLPSRNRVLGVTGTLRSRSAVPNPSDHTILPDAPTAIESPGTPDASAKARTARRLASTAAAYRTSRGGTAPAGADGTSTNRMTRAVVAHRMAVESTAGSRADATETGSKPRSSLVQKPTARPGCAPLSRRSVWPRHCRWHTERPEAPSAR